MNYELLFQGGIWDEGDKHFINISGRIPDLGLIQRIQDREGPTDVFPSNSGAGEFVVWIPWESKTGPNTRPWLKGCPPPFVQGLC